MGNYAHQYYIMRSSNGGPRFYMRYIYADVEEDKSALVAMGKDDCALFRGILPRDSIEEHVDIIQGVVLNANDGGLDEGGLIERIGSIDSLWHGLRG